MSKKEYLFSMEEKVTLDDIITVQYHKLISEDNNQQTINEGDWITVEQDNLVVKLCGKICYITIKDTLEVGSKYNIRMFAKQENCLLEAKFTDAELFGKFHILFLFLIDHHYLISCVT